MHCIGHYYCPEGGLYHLYRANYRMETWVSNLCYYDTTTRQYYSPRMDNIARYGRDMDGQRHDEHWWGYYVLVTHTSFV